MGLDGISVNQLRITQEFNSSESNSALGVNNNEVKPIDGLSSGQKVDPDKESEQDFFDGAQDENDSQDEEEQKQQEDITKYDLSDSSKYILKLDQESNEILIIEKSTKNIIQKIDADELSKFVVNSPNSCGSIINKKL